MDNVIELLTRRNILDGFIVTKIALVIGCSEYNFAGVLVNPINDANSTEKKLQSLGFDVMKITNPI